MVLMALASNVVPFKRPSDISPVRVNRTSLHNLTFLPNKKLPPTEITAEDLVYVDQRWHLIAARDFNLPGMYERTLMYVLLGIHQAYKKSGQEIYKFKFPSSYALLRLMGKNRLNASGVLARDRLYQGLRTLCHTGFIGDFYDDRTKLQTHVEISGVLSGWRKTINVETGTETALMITLNADFIEWCGTRFSHEIELESVLKLTSGAALRMFEVLVKLELKFKQEGMWSIYLKSLSRKLGLNLKYESDKRRYIQNAFENALPALKANFKFSDDLRIAISDKDPKKPTKVTFYRKKVEAEALFGLAL